jgi:regulator of RNase E activity RraA
MNLEVGPMQNPDEIRDIARPDRAVSDALARIGTATLSSELNRLGVRDPHIRGPVPLVPGRTAAGPALTLQCMPKREDLFGGAEYDNPDLQLHRHVMFPAQAGDMIVVDARGDMGSGIFGEMMLTYFAGRGGQGVVIDGCIRDSGPARALDLGIWTRGATPNYHAQTALIPFAVNVPVACGGVLVMPGDIVVADDDGAVVVPIGLAGKLIETASEHAEWEEFSRIRLSQGGDLRVYYPLTDAAQPEYHAWQRARGET